MRWSLVLLAACSFTHGQLGTGDGGPPVDSPPMFDDAGHEIVTWTIDTAADFAKGQSFVDIGIEPWGSLTPAGFFYGGLLLQGLDGTALWHQNDTTFSFDQTAGMTPTQSAIWFGQNIDLGNTTSYFGVQNQNSFSAWVTGEVYLSAGNGHQFRISAGDVAFFEIAPIGSAAYQQVTTTTGTLSFDAPTTGWYPIRIGWSNSSFNFHLHLQHANPGSSTFNNLTRAQLRGRGDTPRGLMQLLCDHQLLTATGDNTNVIPRPQVAASDALATSFNPPLSGQPNGSTFSVRWSGQFYSPTGGMYSFQLDTNNGNQLMVAGQSASSHWTLNDNAGGSSSVSAMLAQGWNDISFDYNYVQGGASLGLSVTAAPAGDSALVGQPLPLARLRAVEPPGDRLAFATTKPSSTIPDNNTNGVTTTLPIAGLPNELVTNIILRLDIQNPEIDQIRIQVTNPRGDQISGLTIPGTGNQHVIMFVPLDSTDSAQFFNNLSPDGNWTVRVADTGGGGGSNTGTFFEADLRVLTHGGPAQIATRGTWDSEIVDNVVNVSSIDNVTWTEASPMPSVVRLRACDAPCTNEAWTAVQNDAAPPSTLAGHRYLQAQVEMASDGTQTPEFDQLTVVYRRPRQ